jgi:hypothetical protein
MHLVAETGGGGDHLLKSLVGPEDSEAEQRKGVVKRLAVSNRYIAPMLLSHPGQIVTVRDHHILPTHPGSPVKPAGVGQPDPRGRLIDHLLKQLSLSGR